jgi:hypothetical protein
MDTKNTNASEAAGAAQKTKAGAAEGLGVDRSALDPSLWIDAHGLLTPPSAAQCARAFGDLEAIVAENEAKALAASEEDREQDQKAAAGFFSRKQGFWVNLGALHMADMAIDCLAESARFYPKAFPWAVAARLRALDGHLFEKRDLAVRAWIATAAEAARGVLPQNAALKELGARLAEPDAIAGWTKSEPWLPEEKASRVCEELWGVFDVFISVWDLVPDGERRMAPGENHEPLTDEEERSIIELWPVLGAAFAQAIEALPEWSAGGSKAAAEDVRAGARWAEDNYPACLLRSEAAIAACEAEALAAVAQKSLDAKKAADLAEPRVAARAPRL